MRESEKENRGCKHEPSKECGKSERANVEIHNSFVLIEARKKCDTHTNTVEANLHSMSNASVAVCCLLPLPASLVPTHRFVLSFVLFVLAQQVGGAFVSLCLSLSVSVCMCDCERACLCEVCVCGVSLGKSEIASERRKSVAYLWGQR